MMTEPTSSIKVFVLDDHELVRRGLVDLLSSAPGLDVVGEAATAKEGLERILAIRPDVAILDGRLPDGSGIDVCRDVRSALPSTYCLILTSFDDEDALLSAVLAGASGYVLKEVHGTGLIDAIRQVALGRSLIDPGLAARVMKRALLGPPVDARLAALKEREREILNLIAEGLTNRQIGAELFVSAKTASVHISNILRKLGVSTRVDAAAIAQRIGLD